MKTLGRIVIILFAFALVMGLTYAAVNAGGSFTASAAPALERGGEGVPRPRNANLEFRGEGGEGGGGWIFGMIKNIGIVAVIVAVIAVPKNISQRKRRNISSNAG